VSEPNWVGSTTEGSNNHRGEGMNLVAMDGSGRWVPSNACRAGLDDWYNGSNRFSDTGQIMSLWPRGFSIVSAGQCRVYTSDGTYTNHLPGTAYQSQRDAIRVRLQKIGYGSWSGN
jgi:hypothetical protein